MLSKLRYFRGHDRANLAKLRNLVRPDHCADQLGVVPDRCRLLSGGTLNLAFRAVSTDGSLRCLKTHLTEDGSIALRQEATLLQALYGDRIELRCIQTADRDWLVMKLLAPIEPADCLAVGPAWILETLGRVAGIEYLPTITDSFADIMAAAGQALGYLSHEGQIHGQTISRLLSSLDRLAEAAGGLDHRLCHGDLGPQNIMRDEGGLILIDWEDMLQAFAGYDWIYWLSFHANRHLISRAALSRSGLPEQLGLDILIAIVLVKSHLSLCSGAAAGHKTPIENRLLGILDLG